MEPIRHAALGMLVAALLAIGASAGSDDQKSASTRPALLNSISIALTLDVTSLPKREAKLFLDALRACGNAVVDVALDAYGEAAGHLRQI
jgi:hypothetical protein